MKGRRGIDGIGRIGGVIAALALALAGSAAADEAGLERLAAARELWAAQGAGSYEYSYRKYCDCKRDGPPQTVVTVDAGRIVAVVQRSDDTAAPLPVSEGSLDLYWTIDGLFDKLAGALDGAVAVRVDYDPERGFPTSLYIDYVAGLVGDETDLREIRVVIP